MKKKKVAVRKKTGTQNSSTKSVISSQSLFEWKFRERAKQDGRAFGNAALYATPQEIDSLVRETGQNSLDAVDTSSDQPQVVIRYRLIELPSGSARREKFLQAINWTSELKPHLDAVAKNKTKASNTAARVKSALEDLAAPSSTLWLLAVEDYGTRGLEGDEYDADMPYCALVRDSENSNKSSEGAGGSFGLGSKTLWACSDLLTVLFASSIKSSKDKIRVIGKSDLGYHELKGTAEHGYVGHGHFGKPFETDAAESVWIPNFDEQTLKNLCLTRSSPVPTVASTGTTALIVGFADPKADQHNAEEILSAIEKAVAKNFWPAIVRKALRVFVRHERADSYEIKESEVKPEAFYPSFIEAYRAQETGDLTTELSQPGEVVSIPVQHTIPATRDYAENGQGHPNVTAEARLIIRLSEPGSMDGDLRDHVALIRGRAMVVKYLPKKNITLGARPFHAILAAGTLVAKTGHQAHAEGFLRSAEPPAHNEWEMSTSVKSRYVHGAGVRIRELFDEMSRLLKEYIGSRQDSGEDIPEILKDILKIADTGKPKQSTYKLSQPEIIIEGHSIRLEAEVECPDANGHAIRPAVTFASESGKGFEMRWLSLDASNGEVTGNRISMPAGKKVTKISGRLESTIAGIDLERCAYQVSIRGAKLEGEK